MILEAFVLLIKVCNSVHYRLKNSTGSVRLSIIFRGITSNTVNVIYGMGNITADDDEVVDDSIRIIHIANKAISISMNFPIVYSSKHIDHKVSIIRRIGLLEYLS